RSIRRVGVIGAGTMGTGIAMCTVEAGLPTALLDRTPELIERGVARIRGLYEAQVRKGRITQDAYSRRMQLLEPGTSFAALSDVDLVIEAVYEDLAVKQAVFRDIEPFVDAQALLASNTSTLDVDRIASVLARPQNFIGLHFFS